MKFSIVILLTLLASLLLEAEDKLGVLIIDPIPMNDVWKGNDTGANENSQFLIKIDKNIPITVNKVKGGSFKLHLGKKHLVDIKLNGKRLTSFYFSFEQYKKNKLRLWYRTMYGTWSISRLKDNEKKKE